MEDIAKYLFELGNLKRVQRTGWWLIGVKHAETVAEHSFRAAAISYILAFLEGADQGKALAMSLFHDVGESRANDIHKLARRYIQWENVEKRVINDQVQRLPQEIAERVTSLFEEFEGLETIEAKVVHDADALECLLQAREYKSQGFQGSEDWIETCCRVLTTESGKRLGRACLELDPNAWWADGAV